MQSQGAITLTIILYENGSLYTFGLLEHSNGILERSPVRARPPETPYLGFGLVNIVNWKRAYYVGRMSEEKYTFAFAHKCVWLT